MDDKQPDFFDTFTGSEAERMETIMAELDGVPWAQAILHGVRQNGGLVGKNMARFFELRYGDALHKAGIAVEYEVSGEGRSTLDFGFTSKGQPWKVEMMRLQETQAAKKATTTEVDPSGVRHAVAWRALWCVLARGPAATLLGWQERVVVPSKEHCMVALTRKDVIEISRPRWPRAGANRLGEPPKSHISVWSSPELLPQLVPLLPLGVQRGSPCPRTIPNIPARTRRSSAPSQFHTARNEDQVTGFVLHRQVSPPRRRVISSAVRRQDGGSLRGMRPAYRCSPLEIGWGSFISPTLLR
jgi:hypothetical protein